MTLQFKVHKGKGTRLERKSRYSMAQKTLKGI